MSWAQHAKNGLPSFDGFEISSRIHDPKQLAAWKVETSNDGTVFRALYRGRLLDEAFKDGWSGKTLAEVTPPSLQVAIISASEHCANTGNAVFTILRTYDSAGYAIDLERLLLPFGNDGRVDLILASLQLISLQGTVDRRNVVDNFEAQYEGVLAVSIAAGSMITPRADFAHHQAAVGDARATPRESLGDLLEQGFCGSSLRALAVNSGARKASFVEDGGLISYGPSIVPRPDMSASTLAARCTSHFTNISAGCPCFVQKRSSTL